MRPHAKHEHGDRVANVTMGYDCREVCEHEKKGDHGIHGDEVRLTVKISPTYAMSMVVFSAVLRGAVIAPLAAIWGNSQRRTSSLSDPAVMACHNGDGARFTDRDSNDCDILESGKCWGDCWYLAASEISEGFDFDAAVAENLLRIDMSLEDRAKAIWIDCADLWPRIEAFGRTTLQDMQEEKEAPGA